MEAQYVEYARGIAFRWLSPFAPILLHPYVYSGVLFSMGLLRWKQTLLMGVLSRKPIHKACYAFMVVVGNRRLVRNGGLAANAVCVRHTRG
jgi:predicted tellurium resistance membrane protein TerC